MKAGDTIQTPHGEGTVENYEIYPPLHQQGPYTYRSSYVGPDHPKEFPEELIDGSFVRIGVRGAHPILNVAYYTAKELGLESFSQANENGRS